MKKTKSMVLILIFLLSTTFSPAHILLVTYGYVASVSSSIPLSAAPYLFKDKDTEYSYTKTLAYSTSFALISPIMAILARNSNMLYSSLVVAPILGAVVGYNLSKKNASSIYNKSKKGWYGGLGIGGGKITSGGYGLTYPAEIGYSITDNLLIHYSLDWTLIKEDKAPALVGGIGASYYIKNHGYIKVVAGNSLIDSYILSKMVKNSIGYGKSISKQTAIEFTYTHFSFSDALKPNVPYFADMFSVSINHRFF